MENVKYAVIDQKIPEGDRFEKIYDTAEGANAAAEYDWGHLSDYDRKRTHIYAARIHLDQLPDYAIDEETGEIDWLLFDDHGTFPGAFDSKENIA